MVRYGLLMPTLLVAIACSPAARDARTRVDTPRERTVHVTPADFGTEITVRTGDVLVVMRPADYAEWDVAFSNDVLRLLNTAAGRRRPPAEGWTFAVLAPGTTEVALTPYVPRGGNVPRYVVTVTSR